MNKIFIVFLNFYRKALSPLLPKSCRFYPSCSEYSIQSFEQYSFLKAATFSIKRIFKCHPFHAGGYDPVGIKKEWLASRHALTPTGENKGENK